jgi:hypothetical protein
MDRSKFVTAINHALPGITLNTPTTTLVNSTLTILANVSATPAQIATAHTAVYNAWNEIADTQGTSPVKDLLYGLERATKPSPIFEDLTNSMIAVSGAVTKQASVLAFDVNGSCLGWRNDTQKAEQVWQVAVYDPLPASGLMTAGEVYQYNGGLVIVRQSHQRTAFTPEQTPALFSIFRPAIEGILTWVANEKVDAGSHRTYLTIEYVCIQTHTTQVDWTPDRTPALWKPVVTPPVTGNWAYPVAYKVNDIVIYAPNGFTYKCLQAHTSQAGWSPPVVPALWQKQ